MTPAATDRLHHLAAVIAEAPGLEARDRELVADVLAFLANGCSVARTIESALRRERDRMIVALCRALRRPGDMVSVAAAAAAITAAAEHYRATGWPKDRALLSSPHAPGTLDDALYRLESAGGLPRDRQLRVILAGAVGSQKGTGCQPRRMGVDADESLPAPATHLSAAAPSNRRIR